MTDWTAYADAGATGDATTGNQEDSYIPDWQAIQYEYQDTAEVQDQGYGNDDVVGDLTGFEEWEQEQQYQDWQE